MATKKQQKYQAQRRKRRRIRRLILLAIVLAFIFIPERTVDAVTEEAPVEVVETAKPVATQQTNVQSATTQESSTTEDSQSQSQVPNKAKKSSDSFSQQFLDSTKPYYTKDKNGLYDLVGPVIDAANLLNTSQYNQLDSFLRNLDETFSFISILL